MSDPVKYSILDLKAGVIESIELELGVPLSRWGTDVKSEMQLYRLVLAGATGKPADDYKDMSLRELQAQVTFEGPDPNP